MQMGLPSAFSQASAPRTRSVRPALTTTQAVQVTELIPHKDKHKDTIYALCVTEPMVALVRRYAYIAKHYRHQSDKVVHRSTALKVKLH